MTHFDRHAFIFDENVQIRTLHDYVSKKKGQQVRLVPKPIREIKLVPGVNQRKIPKFKKPLEQRHIVLKIDPSRLTGEGEEKKEVEEEVKEEKKEVKEEEKKEAMEVEKNETMEIEKSEVKKEVNNEEETEKSEVMEIEKKESTDTEKLQAQESTPIKEDISTQTPETKKEETATPTNTQSTPTNSTDNDLLTDHRDMYFAD